jgi:hypothetical protein
MPPDQQGSRWIFRAFRVAGIRFNMIKYTAIMLIQRVILKIIPFAFDQIYGCGWKQIQAEVMTPWTG